MSLLILIFLFGRPSLEPKGLFSIPLRLRVALRGEKNRNTIGVSNFLAMQRHATQRAAAMETGLKAPSFQVGTG